MKNLLGGFKSIFERAGEKNQEYIFVRWICPMNWNTESREWKEKKKWRQVSREALWEISKGTNKHIKGVSEEGKGVRDYLKK